MFLSGLFLFFLHFLIVNKSQGVDESDKNGHDEDKQVGAISDYLLDHRLRVIELKCNASAGFLPNRPG